MKVYTFHSLSTNNGRARVGLKKHRKLNKKKRFYTRCEAGEAVEAFFGLCKPIKPHQKIFWKGGEKMTVKRVKQAADARGIYFNGVKQWINNFIGYGYYFYGPGGGLYQSDNLSGIYSFIMKYPKTSTI